MEDARASDLFVNRELSLLQFQRRVLEEASDPANPLLERVRFLAIFGSNIDEMVMVRVAGLIMQRRAGVVDFSIDGRTPAETLAAVRKDLSDLQGQAHKIWREELQPALDAAGIHVLSLDQLNAKQRDVAQKIFQEEIFPVLTPQGYDPGHPFPHISSLSLNLAIQLRDPAGEDHFARLKVPALLPRIVPLKRSSGGERRDGTVPHHHYFVWLEQLVAAHMDDLFPGMTILGTHAFRVVRDADIEIQELEAADLLETMTERVYERQFGAVVRLEIAADMSEETRRVLVNNLEADVKDIVQLPEPLGLGGLMQLAEVERFDLKYPPHVPSVPRAFRPETRDGQTIFDVIRQEDVLLHHPYESFDPVVEFLRTAARDDRVLAIKQTLYRVGRKAPVVRALLEARREYRKQVTVLVELKARFDEESNIGWARMLEREGVHVVYGLVGLKTHAKTLLVVRRDEDRVRRYMHLGTGNYNAGTARVYEDFGLFTADEELGADVTDLFNYLTGYSALSNFRKLLVAPLNLRAKLTELIDREIEHAKAGQEAHVIVKCNSLVDESIIRRLYAASRAGVGVDLIVRGMCSLRPGLPGISENIRVRSIVGRFLEHSRVFCFHNAGKPKVYLGSADLMLRNLDHRVEVLFPVTSQPLVNRIRDRILASYLVDDTRARRMNPDGSYTRVHPGNGKAIDSQAAFLATVGKGKD